MSVVLALPVVAAVLVPAGIVGCDDDRRRHDTVIVAPQERRHDTVIVAPQERRHDTVIVAPPERRHDTVIVKPERRHEEKEHRDKD